MKCEQVLEVLKSSKPILTERFGLLSIALFGSIIRDKTTQPNDVDILVSFDGPATSERYFGVQFYLEDRIGLPVDLVTDKALREELKPYILKEALYV
jgi:uncharacterized protein